MLDGYQAQTTKEQNRVAVVKAALEIAKASVGGADASVQAKTDYELQHVTNEIGNLADAIQAAIDKN